MAMRVKKKYVDVKEIPCRNREDKIFMSLDKSLLSGFSFNHSNEYIIGNVEYCF